MLGVVPVETVQIRERRSRFFERNAVLLEVGERFRDVPCERFIVYTVIRPLKEGSSVHASLRACLQTHSRRSLIRGENSLFRAAGNFVE